MYHRYMPSGNGQYRRQDIPEKKPEPPKPPVASQESHPQAQQSTDKNAFVPVPPLPSLKPQTPSEPSKAYQAPAYPIPFLEKLFPGMDSGDLLLLLIMLLLISEGTEDSVSVVMTLAIFLILQ